MPQQSGRIDLSVFLVDDGSTDGTSESVKDWFPAVHLIRGSGNLYWTGAMRVAFQAATSADTPGGFTHYLWLNDDTMLEEDALERMTSTHHRMKEQMEAELIVVGSVVDPESGRTTYGGIRRLEPLPFIYRLGPSDTPRRCHTMHGNCVLVPAAITETVGNLDEALTHGRGDLDYGLRATGAGFTVWTSPGVLGTCPGHPIGAWRNLRIPLRRRLQALHEPKYAMREKVIVARRHYGFLWFLSPVAVYAYIFLSHPLGWFQRALTRLQHGSTEPASK
jgi:GT2 family glycosyltransferase